MKLPTAVRMPLLAAWIPLVHPTCEAEGPGSPAPHRGGEFRPGTGVPAYPDEPGLRIRSRLVLEGVASSHLDKWRRGYFTGGDPGKYLPGHAMAKHLLNPEDPEPAQYLNDDRSYREHYHFAAVNWARLLPLMGDELLTPETQARLAEAAAGYGSYLNHGGTENHKVMWWSSAAVLPWYLKGDGTLSRTSKEEALASAKEKLRNYVKGLYLAGQGEWDSNTYWVFMVNGLLNIYDYSEDPEARLLARAGLDYLTASYAVKYRNGIFAGPHQRGFPKPSYQSLADQTGFLWWGDEREVTPEDTRGWRYSLHAITSGYRPNQVLTRIAKKEGLPFPVEQRNSKANYWHGRNLTPTPGTSHETVYVDEAFTLASLWDAHASQHSRFNVVTREGHIFTGGHPRRSDHNGKKIGLGYEDGTGRYLQSAQAGPFYVALARWPETEEAAFTYFRYPGEVSAEAVAGWQVFRSGATAVAVTPVSASGEMIPERVELGKNQSAPILKFPSRDSQSGFAVWAGNVDEVEQLKAITVRFEPEAGRVILEAPGQELLSLTFNPDPDGDHHGSRAARVTIGGEPVDLSDWRIFDGALLRQTPGILTVSDGRDAFTIDFTGDLPVYK